MKTEKKDKILIVDDEAIISSMLQRIYNTEGFDGYIAEDGETALELIFAGKLIPDCIILDVMMPGISGYDVCKILKTQRRYNLIPIIMLTAKGRSVDKLLGLRVGANEYINKPFEIDYLIERTKYHIEHSRSLINKKVLYDMKFSIQSDYEFLNQVNELISKLFIQTDLSDDVIMELEFCMNEALMNAIEHGNKINPDKDIKVWYTLTEDKLEFKVKDKGKGFNLDMIPNPTEEDKILKPRGRGIYIMSQLMDEVKFDNDSKTLILTKYLSRKMVDGKDNY